MFNLTRYFSTLSFVIIVLVGGVLGNYYRSNALNQLVADAEAQSLSLATIYRNSLWPRLANLIELSYLRDISALKQADESVSLRQAIIDLMIDTSVIKVKLYNRDGLTILSTDPSQTGERKHDNAGFRAAMAGKSVSELTHRNTFDSFEGVLSGVDVVSSYLPLAGRDGSIAGVFEVYLDVTPTIKAIDRSLWQVTLTIVCIMAVLFIAQFLVVVRAQRILREQSAALEEANRDLDQRVQARTAELQKEIAERRETEKRLDHLAHHDPLTGLPNRIMFAELLRHRIGFAERHEHQLAVLFIDLDRFKEVNDTLGHAIGDELLVAVTRRLQSHLRGADTLARLGGDEFICLIESVKHASEVKHVADKLIDLLSQPFEIFEHELFVAASIGICLYPADGGDVDTLVRNADTAMYQAKAHGRGRSHFYAPEMTLYAQERTHLEALLRRAIEAGELSVHYQVKVDHAGQPSGAEALLRWNSAELGSVSPVKFIPLAEETGYIVALGEWVLRQACLQMVTWRANGLMMPKVSVNVSVKQIAHGDIVTMVRRVLLETGLEPPALELEITESVIMNADDALSILESLHGLGVKLAIDDFGTGYSSLAYLKRLPIDTLKIDRSFILGIGENSGDEAIIRTILALARSLGLDTVAEGVDADHQVSFLRHQGCEQIQGYLYGKPQPAVEFAAQWQSRLAGP